MTSMCPIDNNSAIKRINNVYACTMTIMAMTMTIFYYSGLYGAWSIFNIAPACAEPFIFTTEILIAICLMCSFIFPNEHQS